MKTPASTLKPPEVESEKSNTRNMRLEFRTSGQGFVQVGKKRSAMPIAAAQFIN